MYKKLSNLELTRHGTRLDFATHFPAAIFDVELLVLTNWELVVLTQTSTVRMVSCYFQTSLETSSFGDSVAYLFPSHSTRSS